ncbi:MAG: GHKL domain-containing protein [Lachnospiraceae bacterium]|nr:GHKL domain-containing protein [Lachnospiraceae bacterium]
MDRIFYSYAINLLYVYLNIRIIKIFLTKKERHPIPFLLLYMIICSVTWISDSMFHSQANTTILLFLLLYFYSFYYFEASTLKRMAVIAVSIGLTNVTQGIVLYFCRYSNLIFREHRYYSCIPPILVLALVMIWEHFLSFQQSDTAQTIYHFQIIFICLSSISLCGILLSVTVISPIMLCVCLFVIYLINIMSLIMYSKLSSMQQKELDHKALEQRVLMYQNQFQIMQQSQNELRSLRHDLKNHLLLVEKYLKTDQANTAIQYIQDLTQTHLTTDACVNTGNHEIDCVFNYLLGSAKQIGCEMQTSIKIPSQTFMPTLDLNILISNLLTNAIEAMSRCDKKYLNVTVKYDRNILYISVHNTYQGKLRRQNNDFLTTKKEQQLHGYGFKNIHAIIEKYHGNSKFRTENNIFKADIILYMKSD